ncbi:MAG: hypothetical protein GXO26_05935 [Crenarchaeota archaeon]|nr:hypothetical protein [Thermoproteota archaeon]
MSSYYRIDLVFSRTRKYYYADVVGNTILRPDQKVLIVRRDAVNRIGSLQTVCYGLEPSLVSAYVNKLVNARELVELVNNAIKPTPGSVKMISRERVRITAPLSLGTEEKVETIVFPTMRDYEKFIEELALGIWCYVLGLAAKVVNILDAMRRVNLRKLSIKS